MDHKASRLISFPYSPLDRSDLHFLVPFFFQIQFFQTSYQTSFQTSFACIIFKWSMFLFYVFVFKLPTHHLFIITKLNVHLNILDWSTCNSIVSNSISRNSKVNSSKEILILVLFLLLVKLFQKPLWIVIESWTTITADYFKCCWTPLNVIYSKNLALSSFVSMFD